MHISFDRKKKIDHEKRIKKRKNNKITQVKKNEKRNLECKKKIKKK